MRWRSGGWTAVVVVALALATAVAAGQTAGQPANDTAGAPPATATVTATAVALGGWTFDLDPNEPLVVYVVERTTTLGGATVRLQPFARTTYGFVPLPSYETAATGSLATAAAGDALVLAAEPANGG